MPPFWAVVHTQPHREPLAVQHLEAGGFEVFAPRIDAGRGAIAQMFSGYIFVRIYGLWRAIDATVGVIRVIRFGDGPPARCPDAEIARLQGRVGADGLVSLPRRRIAIGTRVQLSGGLVEGVYAGMSAHKRSLVMVLGAAG